MTGNEECDIYFVQSELVGMKTDVHQMTLLNTNTTLQAVIKAITFFKCAVKAVAL